MKQTSAGCLLVSTEQQVRNSRHHHSCATDCVAHDTQDGTSKMSKSAESDLSRINLLDDANAIRNKVKRAKTDTFEGLEFDHPERPEAHNLLTIYGLMTGNSKVCHPQFRGPGWHQAGSAAFQQLLSWTRLISCPPAVVSSCWLV